MASPIEDLRAAGFNEAEIGDWAAGKRKELTQAGFRDDEVDTYLGGPAAAPVKTPNWFERVGIARPGSPVAEKGLLGAIEGIPGEIKDWWENTPTLVERSRATREKAAVADRLWEEQTGTKLKPGMHSPEGWDISLSNPMLSIFAPGEGITRGFGAGRMAAADLLAGKTAAAPGPELGAAATLRGEVPTPERFDNAARVLVAEHVPDIAADESAIRSYVQGGEGYNSAPIDRVASVVLRRGYNVASPTVVYRGHSANIPPVTEGQAAVSTSDFAGGQAFSLARNEALAEEGRPLPVAQITLMPGVRALDPNKFGGSRPNEMEKLIAGGRLVRTGKPPEIVQDGHFQYEVTDYRYEPIAGAVLSDHAPVAQKLRDIYEQTGITPEGVAADVSKDPTIAQDLLSDSTAMPRRYQPLVDHGIASVEEAPGGGGDQPPKPPEPPAEGSPEAARQKVLGKISVGERTGSEPTTFERLYTALVDDLNPIRQAVKEATAKGEMPTGQDPYQLARLTRGTFGKADQMLERGTFDFNTYADTGKGLRDVLAPVADDLDGLRAYAASKRAIELAGRDIESGIDLDAAKQVVADSGKKYEPVLRDLVDYQNRTTKYLKDSGILSDETYRAMLAANKNYVPFFRVLDDGGASGIGKGLNAHNPIKAIKGSERVIVDPLESVIKNTYLYTSLAERNAVGRAFVAMANGAEGKGLIEKVAPSTKPTTVAEPEMAKFLAAHGIDNPPEDLLTVFRATRTPLADNEIAVFEGGKRTVYKVDPEIAAAFKGMDSQTAGLLTKIMAIPARTLRAGATLTPDFMVRNVIRDFTTAFVNTKGAIFSPIDTAKGLKGLLTQDMDFQNWLKAGGANANLVSLDRRYLQESLAKLNAETGLMDRAWNVVDPVQRAIENGDRTVAGNPLTGLRMVSELMENATRLGEFKKLAGGATDKGQMQAAAFSSREVTLDFARIGARMRAYNMITAFANANIQGTDRLIRAFAEKPAATSFKIAGAVSLPSALLWWANHEDPRYAEIPQWQKDLFWIVLTKEHVYRIPKPFETGIMFGSGVERTLDAYYAHNPEAFDGFFQSVWGALTPGFVPTAVQPMVEQFANRSTFTGNPLVPASVEKLLPEYQYNPYTTETTKKLASVIAAFPGMRQASLEANNPFGPVARALTTPVLIDNYVRAWTGGLGVYTQQVVDAGLRKAGVVPDPVLPAATLADIPIIRAFVVRYPSATAQSVQEFYDRFAEKKRVFDTFMAKAQEGDVEATQKVQQFDPSAMAQLSGYPEALTSMSQVIRGVYKDPGIPADEKRQIIDTMYFRMIEVAKAGNEALDQAEVRLKPAVVK